LRAKTAKSHARSVVDGQNASVVTAIGLDKPMAAKNHPPLTLRRRPVVKPALVEPLEIPTTARTSPMVIFGAPGTGKTTTLIESVVTRINAGLNPNNILILAYGRERASMLRDAVVDRTSATAIDPLARTFHALAFSIINEEMDIAQRKFVMVSGAEQDTFIRSLLENEHGGSKVKWPEDLKEAITTRAFAREMRDLIMRGNEFGLNYSELRKLGQELGEPYWNAAADFWFEYDEVMALRYAPIQGTPLRIDPSAIITEANRKLDHDPSLVERFRERYPVIYVDEFQESDDSQRALLKKIAGRDLTLFADLDSTVGRFRGADPDGVIAYCDSIGAQQHVLTTVHRGDSSIQLLAQSVAGKIRGRSPGRLHTGTSNSTESEKNAPSSTSALAIKLTSQADCASYIAYQFRKAHLMDGVPWSEMAVILRSPGAAVTALQRAFAANNIPLGMSAGATTLTENPLVRPLLSLAQIAIGSLTLTSSNWPIVEELLRSEIGGADALSLRAMRLRLVREHQIQLAENQELEPQSSTDLILEAIKSHDLFIMGAIPLEEMQPIARLRTLITAGRTSLKKSRDISDLLFAIWSAALDFDGAPLAEALRSRALRGGVRGAAADRDLDAVLQLFESARRFSERMPFSRPSLFIEELMDETILSDAITARAQREEVVSILTVHSAKGREWSHVALMGLEEGVWPNLRQRGSLLGSERLAESVRTGLTSRVQLDAASSNALVDDERRLLHVALTRATTQLYVLSFHDSENEPSSYFEEIYEVLHPESASAQTGEIPTTNEVPRSLTQQALVATLRRSVEGRGVSEQKSEQDSTLSDSIDPSEAASLLKTLSENGIRSANPDTWTGVQPISSLLPLIPAGEVIRVSPSNLQNFSECGLKWFLEKNGARDGDSSALTIGSAIHALAALLHKEPTLSLDQLQSRLSDNWKFIDNNAGWVKSYELQEAMKKLAKFFTWHHDSNRTLVGVEAEFTIELGDVLIVGSADRVEVQEDFVGTTDGTPERRTFILDLKTGNSDSTKDEAEVNLQLSGYQLAAAMKKFNSDELNEALPDISGGAKLVYLGTDGKTPSEKPQSAIDVEQATATIIATAEKMGASTFDAVVSKRCRTCGVRALCPLRAEGRSVIDE
jgi:superfamily I DNA/RNA helicase